MDVFAESSYPVLFKHVRPLIGMGGDKLLPRVAAVNGKSEEAKRLGKRQGEIFRSRYLSSLRPFSGVRALLERMRGDGLSLVIATSAQTEDMRLLLEQAGVADLIEEHASASDSKESKPDPDIVEAAVARSGRGANECIMLGDTPYDVQAATAAGVSIVALRSGGWDAAALRGAAAVYADAADLLAHYESSPFGSAGDAAR